MQITSTNSPTTRTFTQEDRHFLLLLLALFESEGRKWDELRALKDDSAPSKEEQYKDYFDKVFEKGIPSYQLDNETTLYRARLIKSANTAELGVDITTLMDSFYISLLSEEDIQRMKFLKEEGNLPISSEIMFALKVNMENNIENYEAQAEEFENKYKAKGVYGFAEKGIRVPPLNARHLGRFNAKEDAFLYLALDRDTAIYEMRPSIKQYYCIGEFISNKKLRMVDMRGDYTGQELYPGLSTVAGKVSETNTDGDEWFYSITKYMSHYLLERKYDGIIYKSSINKDGINIMLFDETNVDFVSSEIVQINETKIEFSNILPFSNE